MSFLCRFESPFDITPPNHDGKVSNFIAPHYISNNNKKNINRSNKNLLGSFINDQNNLNNQNNSTNNSSINNNNNNNLDSNSNSNSNNINKQNIIYDEINSNINFDNLNRSGNLFNSNLINLYLLKKIFKFIR
mgnify:CR=1 FL=1